MDGTKYMYIPYLVFKLNHRNTQIYSEMLKCVAATLLKRNLRRSRHLVCGR